jgi:aryl-alcohol dehydrogenase-like predicted oxidoreductase
VAYPAISEAGVGGNVLQKRGIGQTGIEVSLIGLGTVKFGRNQGLRYPAPITLPTDKEIETLLSVAKDLGINLLDTAPAYGSSEERLGKCLGKNRHDWIISTKAGETFQDGKSYFNFTSQAIQQSIEQSLKKLKTDYLDIVLIHSNGDDERIIEEENVFDVLAACQQAGKIRAYGMSTKTVRGGLLTLERADVAMVTFNSTYIAEQEVIDFAHQHQKNIFIKKALGSGQLLPQEALQFVCREPGVTSVIVGTLNPAHLRENVESVG